MSSYLDTMFCWVFLSESGGWNECINERDLVINSKSGLIPPEITSSVYWIAALTGCLNSC